ASVAREPSGDDAPRRVVASRGDGCRRRQPARLDRAADAGRGAGGVRLCDRRVGARARRWHSRSDDARTVGIRRAAPRAARSARATGERGVAGSRPARRLYARGLAARAQPRARGAQGHADDVAPARGVAGGLAPAAGRGHITTPGWRASLRGWWAAEK